MECLKFVRRSTCLNFDRIFLIRKKKALRGVLKVIDINIVFSFTLSTMIAMKI